jgi:translation initiation factor 2B subunit (eIF-2B alpha/beta/delta family)
MKKRFIDKVLKQLQDMIEDIECIYDEVIRQAHEHINSKDIVLTFSQSDLLDSFLTAAYNGVEEDGE